MNTVNKSGSITLGWLNSQGSRKNIPFFKVGGPTSASPTLHCLGGILERKLEEGISFYHDIE